MNTLDQLNPETLIKTAIFSEKKISYRPRGDDETSKVSNSAFYNTKGRVLDSHIQNLHQKNNWHEPNRPKPDWTPPGVPEAIVSVPNDIANKIYT